MWQWRLILCSEEIDITGREVEVSLAGIHLEVSRWVEDETGIEQNKYPCNGSPTHLAQ